MKCVKTLFTLVLCITFVGIVMSQFCPTRCPKRGQTSCPTHCQASRQRVIAIYCCTIRVRGNNICCWYRGYGLLCQGSRHYCSKYVQGYGDQFDDEQFGACARDRGHNLYCDTRW